MATHEIELADAIERAERAERREEQFRNWWTGVSKQLRDLQHDCLQKDWAHATNCETHGKQLQELDADALRLSRLQDRAESERVRLVVGLQVLQDIVRAHRAGQTRADLTVDELMGAFENIVWRTLGQEPETKKRPADSVRRVPRPSRAAAQADAVPDALFEIDRSAA